MPIPMKCVTHYGSFLLDVMPDISQMGRITSDVRGMSVTQFIGVGHIAKTAQGLPGVKNKNRALKYRRHVSKIEKPFCQPSNTTDFNVTHSLHLWRAG